MAEVLPENHHPLHRLAKRHLLHDVGFVDPRPLYALQLALTDLPEEHDHPDWDALVGQMYEWEGLPDQAKPHRLLLQDEYGNPRLPPVSDLEHLSTSALQWRLRDLFHAAWQDTRLFLPG
jgi:hypothetical protein